MSLIPPESDYQEYCKHCHEFYVPHWTNCNCESKHVKRDLDKVMELVLAEMAAPRGEISCGDDVGDPGDPRPSNPPKPEPKGANNDHKKLPNKPATAVDEHLDRLSEDWFT